MSLTIESVNNQEILSPTQEINTNNEESKQIAEYANDFFANIPDDFKNYLAIVGIASIENFGCKKLLVPAFREMQWNFYPRLPQLIKNIASHVTWFNQPFSLLGPFSPIGEAATDELLFRVILQEGLLKTVPEKILNRVAPEHAPAVNSTSAKIARIALSSLAYSLFGWAGHTSSTHFIAFARGILFGALQEKTGTPLLNMVYHIGTIASDR
jgi:Type II CAAX prenyl endopeptidase Rce1-like